MTKGALEPAGGSRSRQGERLQLLDGHVAAIGAAGFQQLEHHLPVTLGAQVLEHWRGVRLQAQPLQPVDDHLHGGLGGPFAVRVLDAQKIGSARVACI